MSSVTVMHLKRHDGARAIVCVGLQGVPGLEQACSALQWNLRDVEVEKTHHVPVYILETVGANKAHAKRTVTP